MLHTKVISLIVEKGVPQGSTLGPLLSSVFIKDLSEICLNCSVHLYADDTVIYTTNSDLSPSQNSLQSDFNLVQKWFHNNMLMLNKRKSCCMLFSTRWCLAFDDYIVNRTYGCLRLLYRSINYFTCQVRKIIIYQVILHVIDYADIVDQNTSDTYLKPLNVVYNSLCRFVLRCPYRTHNFHTYEMLNWLHPESRRQFHWFLFILKCLI